ncbi:hypothetical protein BGZ96_012129 [Linnemannia gamsii]|uniref:Uncharacterized protein n=1 Tax=Linnemannia gamsii TaxID=64522 RepID=A0ABQ7JR01_9FUNG|nr:hypothetical protein BGZ96_012129 [Linnemannia gamsii]
MALSFLTPFSLASLVNGTYVEVTGPFHPNSRGGQHAVYLLTTGSIACFRDPNSPSRWFGFRNGDVQVEYFDWKFQLPNNLNILALHKTLANALRFGYTGRHTPDSVDANLSRIQPLVNRHLYSDTMTPSTVHILFDFPFVECHNVSGREVQVNVVITVEFYQAPWREGIKRWTRWGSLNVINVACHMTSNPEDPYTFLEVVAMDPMPDSRIVQSQVTPAALQQSTVLSTAAAFANPGSLLAQNARSLVTTPPAPNSISHGSQAVSNSFPGLDFDLDDMLMTVETTPWSENAGIDLSPPNSSSSETLSEPGLFKNQSRFGPPNFQGPKNALSGSSTSISFQQDGQLSFTNNGFLAADASVKLPQTPGAAGHQMVDDPVSNSEVIDDNWESLFAVVSNSQDVDTSVVNLDADQPATPPTTPDGRFPCTSIVDMAIAIDTYKSITWDASGGAIIAGRLMYEVPLSSSGFAVK